MNDADLKLLGRVARWAQTAERPGLHADDPEETEG